MEPALIVTDLDGTILEPDGTLPPETRRAVRHLVATGIPVCLVTSKTAAEVQPILAELGIATPAGVENGAVVLTGDEQVQWVHGALPYARLLVLAAELKHRSGISFRTLPELDDQELGALTGLPPERVGAVRQRLATCPLVVPPSEDNRLRAFAPAGTSLVRGNRFLHFQGQHSKASALPTLRAAVGHPAGPIVALGDAPNDRELLLAADIPIVVPGPAGPRPELVREVPHARVAPAPHGRGWAAAIRDLLG